MSGDKIFTSTEFSLYETRLDPNKPTVVSNIDDVVLNVNDTFCNTFGYSRAELVGMRAFEFMVPKEYQRLVTDGTLRRLENVVDSYECPVVCKDGSRINVVCTAYPLMNGERVVGSIAEIVPKGL